MAKLNSFEEQFVFRIALYGVRSSGKTCILSALSIPRVSHPENLSCTWIENVPGHPLPKGDPDSWDTNDPFHLGWKWLNEQRNRLKSGQVPAPNPNSSDPMRFLFAFGSPNQGTRYIEVLDYSGELITASASDLAIHLRDHMRSCNGILILAEVPHQGVDQTPHAEDLEKLKGAFLLLLNDRESGPQPDWPIALLFNKWDRREIDSGNSIPKSKELINTFLNQVPQPPQASLIQALSNAVGEPNLSCFPVSAFGNHQIGKDGAEVPVFEGGMLKSARLEDGFWWVTERHEILEVQKLEQAATKASWYRFWEAPFDSKGFNNRPNLSFWKKLIWRNSPWTGILASWKLSRHFPSKGELFRRVQTAQKTFVLKAASQLGACAFLLFFLVSTIQCLWLGLQYQKVDSTLKNPTASVSQIQFAEDWLESYATAPIYTHWLAYWTISTRSNATDRLYEFRETRDDNLWNEVTKANTQESKLKCVQNYLGVYPSNGRRTNEANSFLTESTLRQEESNNLAHLTKVELNIDSFPTDLSANLEGLQTIVEEIDKVPHPAMSSRNVDDKKKSLRIKVSKKQSLILEASQNADNQKFKQNYISLMNGRNIRDSARILAIRKSNDPFIQDLIIHFDKEAPEIIRKKVLDGIKNRTWQSARDAVNLSMDPNVAALISPTKFKELRKLNQEIDEGEDRDLYSQIGKYAPQCVDQVNAYLNRAPLKVMKKEVEEYNKYLAKLKGPLELTLNLNTITWHSDYYYKLFNYTNNVTVYVRGKPIISITDIRSKPNTRSSDLGSGTLKENLDETVSITVDVVAKWGYFRATSDAPGGTGSWTGTLRQLRSGITIELKCEGFSNQAALSLDGIPPEPNLPEWTR